MPELRVEVHELEPGDKLLPSGRTVLAIGVEADTPNEYRNLTVECPDAGKRKYQFHAHTKVRIERIERTN